MYFIFDVGGTKTRLATAENKTTIKKIEIIKTPRDWQTGIDILCQKAQEMSGGKKIKKIIGGLPGPLNEDKAKLVGAPNLNNWINKPIKQEIHRQLKAPVILENDAVLGGLGEANFGVGKNFKIVAYLTISTGVGGARIINGKIDENNFGFEPGHQIISFSANNTQTLENNISGTFLQKKYGQPGYKLKQKAIWQKEAQLLAYGLNNICVLWSPQIIILGGSLMKTINLQLVKKYLKKTLKIFPKLPEIKKSKLGDKSGLYGALSLINK